jgi:hypothetical protein
MSLRSLSAKSLSNGAESSGDNDDSAASARVNAGIDGSGDSDTLVDIDHTTVAETLYVRVCECSDVPRSCHEMLLSHQPHVEIALRYGSSLLVEATSLSGFRTTRSVQAVQLDAGRVVWNERVSLDALVCDLPREAYLDIRLTSYNRDDDDAVLVAWARLTLFNGAGRLRHGTHRVALHAAEKQLKRTDLLPVVFDDNAGTADAIILQLQFDERVDHGTVMWRRRDTGVMVARIPYDVLSPNVRATLDDVSSRHNAMTTLSVLDCRTIWQWRRALLERPSGLALVLRAAPIQSGALGSVVDELHALVRVCAPPEHPLDVVELLSAHFVDTVARRWAVAHLEAVDDDNLLHAMRALVHGVLCELYHDCALVRFVLRRAVLSRRVGQRLFWLLRVELQHSALHATRIGLMLETLLRADGAVRASLTRQQQLISSLSAVVTRLQAFDEARDKRALGTAVDVELRDLSRSLISAPVEYPLDCR